MATCSRVSGIVFGHRAQPHRPGSGQYRIRIVEQPLSGPRFACNDLPFEDLSGVDHDQFTEGPTERCTTT